MVTLSGLDAASEPLTFGIATQPTKGKLGAVTSAGASSAKVTYTPTAGFKGLDAFTFRVKDPTLSSQAATVVVLVGIAAEVGKLSSVSVAPKWCDGGWRRKFTPTLVDAQTRTSPLTRLRPSRPGRTPQAVARRSRCER